MQSARDSTSTSISSSSSSRSLLTRIAAPFTTKPRNLTDFHIKLEDDGRQYFTKDTVKGSVRLRVHKPTRITHLSVSLAGRAQVYKNPITPGDTPRSSALLNSVGRGKNTGQYHGNGLATLFEEETVLCGDGRLAEGTYQFNFELDFPERDLPSSVDFERGKIWYVVMATLTRPTTIAPVSNCEREVNFSERIDIAPLYPPKPRTIILDPISKRSKAKTLKRIDTIERKAQKQPAQSQSEAGESSVRPSVSSQDNDRPLSPVPSELSVDSHVSSSVGLPSHNGGGSIPASSTASFASRPGHGKTIGTTIESCAGGCLRGDILSVKVTVHHTKYTKSMHGIIVTLYRHARVDTQPALTIGPLNDQGRNAEPRNPLPQSRTGLSGLSLTGAGSAHIFRKDLAQAVCPLVVNPTTLTADVVVKLRVPEDAFPTITGVPGTMISFKYYVEVIVDIQGKLSSSAIISPLNEQSNNTMTGSTNVDWGQTAFNPSRIIDTGYVRRDRAVVCASFELIIGTVDSERKKGKRRAALDEDESQVGSSQEQTYSAPAHPPTFESVQALATPSFLGRRLSDNNSSYSPDYMAQSYTNGYRDSAVPAPPLPQLPDESQLSEKERIRLAETRLLPSQPPGMDDDLDDGNNFAGATAPRLDDDEDMPQYSQHAQLQDYHAATSSSEGAGLDLHETSQPYMNGHEPQSIDHSHLQAPENMTLHSDEVQDQSQLGENAGRSQVPCVTADDMHDSHAEAAASADLPRYER